MNELHIDKTNWKKYRFDEVCWQVNETTKDPAADGLDHVVGLEHIEPNNLHITQWDTLEKETTFTRKFKKGQVLFGSRRAYQIIHGKIQVAQRGSSISKGVYVY